MAPQNPDSFGNFQNRRGNFPNGLASEGGNSIVRMIRSLHEGRIGNLNLRWIVDLAAVSMLFLTGTGIYLSLKILRLRNKNIEV